MMRAANSGNRQALCPGLSMPSSCYFHPNKLLTLLAHLSTVQPSVPLSEQTTDLGVLWIPKKGPECSLSEVYSTEQLLFHSPLCGWHYGAWNCLRPKEGRMEEAAQLRGLATCLSVFWVSLTRVLAHSFLQCVFTANNYCVQTIQTQ